MLQTLDTINPNLHVLIIDDGSPDGTAAVVKKFQEKKKNLHILERKGKLALELLISKALSSPRK